MTTHGSTPILAFDLRVADSKCPRTIDPNIWDQPDDDLYNALRCKAAAAAGKDLEWTYNPIGMYLMTCIPRAWLRDSPRSDIAVIALVSVDHGPARDAARQIIADAHGCDITLRDVADAGWVSLGFDVADDQLMGSLLYTFGGSAALAALVEPGALNEHGLFRVRNTALQFASSNGEVSPHHSPFLPIQVFVHNTFASAWSRPSDR